MRSAGSALFYPHIDLKSPSMVKAMALFYDTVYRIVPPEVVPEDAEELQPLLEDSSIGCRIDPTPFREAASGAFLDRIGSGMWTAASIDYEDELVHMDRLHGDKVDTRVRSLIESLGLRKHGDWFDVPSDLASNYMLYLAETIASANGLEMVTNNWDAWTAANYFSLDGAVDEYVITVLDDDPPDALAMFGIALTELMPANIAQIPASDILLFREKRRDEIGSLRQAIEEMRGEFMLAASGEVREERIRQGLNTLSKAMDDYRASADFLKVFRWAGVSFMGIPTPIAVAKLFGLSDERTMALAAASIAIGVVCSLEKTRLDMRKLTKENPLGGYVYDLRKTFDRYTGVRGGGDVSFHAFNCMDEYVND